MSNSSHAGVKKVFLTLLSLSGIILLLVLSSCSGGSSNTPTTTDSTAQQSSSLPIVMLPSSTFQISLFASGTKSYNNPDAVEVDGGHVFIDYQNTTAKDCTDTNSSTIVEYTMDGKVVKTFSMPGHSDGMRVDPSTHLLWVTSCEDGNAKFATIDPSSGTVTPYTFPPAPHKGGYDDMYFLNGKVFVAASNPTPNSSGINIAPAIDEMTLSGSKVVLTPVLMGNATATDTISNTKVTLNLLDPDSMTVDANGDLVLVDQGDSQIIFISNPGTPQQKVSRTQVGSQLDDTVWPTSSNGRLLIVDAARNQTFWISGSVNKGAVYTELPSDSGVAGVFGQIDLSTGIITPLALGFLSPSGLLFVPGS